jgi:tetratricopeptide (TPR) repeat protein
MSIPTAVGIAIAFAILLIAGLLAWRGKRIRSDWRNLRSRAPRRAPQPAADIFVGRGAEERRFTEILREFEKADAAGRTVLITGVPGIGKTELLRRLAQLAAQQLQQQASPVLSLDTYSSERELMHALAESVQGTTPGAFARFLDDSQSASREHPSGIRIAHSLASDVAGVAENNGLSIVKPALSILDSATVRGAVAYADYSPSLADITARFLTDLEVATKRGGRPKLLFVANLGGVASDHVTRWMLDELLPRLESLPILIMLDAANDLPLPRGRPGQYVRWTLGPLTPDEVMDYGRQPLGLTSDYALDQLVRTVDGLPARLSALRTYFDGHEQNGQLSSDAIKFALTQSLTDLPGMATPARRVLLALSACRSFNVTLVEQVATQVTGLDDAQVADVLDELLDPTRRPPFMVESSAGWSLGNERLALLDQWRRTDPAGHRKAHRTAALYHLGQIRTLDTESLTDGVDEPGLAELTAFEPSLTSEQCRNEVFVAATNECLYHSVALAPNTFFPRLIDAITQAICNEPNEVVAARLLDLDGAVQLDHRQRALVNQLRRAVDAKGSERWFECSKALVGVLAIGCPTRIARCRLLFASGFAHWNCGQPGPAAEAFDRSLDLLSELTADRFVVELRNLVWPWWVQATRETGGPSTDPCDIMARLRAEAESLGDDDLLAETYRAEGVLLADSSPDVAEANYLRALKLVRSGMTKGAEIVIRRDLGYLYILRDQPAKARAQLDAAEELAQVLQDSSQLTNLRLIRFRLELKSGVGEPDSLRKSVLALQPGSADILNDLANAYSEVGRLDDARKLYQEAIDTAAAPVYLVNLAKVEFLMGQTDENLIRSSEDNLRRAIELAPDDLSSRLELVRHLQRANRGVDAAAAATDAARVALERFENMKEARSSIGDSPDTTTKYLLEAIESCPPARRVELLKQATKLRSGDTQLWAQYARRLDEIRMSQPTVQGMRDMTEQLVNALGTVVGMMDGSDPTRLDHLISLIRLESDSARYSEATSWLADAERQHAHDQRLESLRRRIAILRSDELAGERGALRPCLSVLISPDLVPWVNPAGPLGHYLFSHYLERAARPTIGARWGVVLPAVRAKVNEELSATIQVLIQGREAVSLHILGEMLCAGAVSTLVTIAPSAREAQVPWTDEPMTWVAGDEQPLLAEAGVPTWDPRGVLCCVILHAVDTHIDRLSPLNFAVDAPPLDGDENPPALHDFRVSAISRELLARRRPVHDAATIRRAVLENDALGPVDIVDMLIENWAAPVDHEIRETFEQFRSNLTDSGPFTIRVPPSELGRVTADELAATQSAVEDAAREFGLPVPIVAVRPSGRVTPGTFEVWCGENCLARHRWDTAVLTVWREHPAPGDPRLWIRHIPGGDPCGPALVIRQFLCETPEQIPALLDDSGARALAEASPDGADPTWWADVLGTLLHLRVPLPELTELNARAQPLVGDPAPWAAAQLANDLGEFEVALVLSPGVDPGGDLGKLLSANYEPVAGRFFEDFGVDVPPVLTLRTDPSLPIGGWEIRLNGVRRVVGQVPSRTARVEPVVPGAEPTADRVWVHPIDGSLHVWRDGGTTGLPVEEVLAVHLIDSIHLALTEFADLSWLRRHLRRVAESDQRACAAMLSIGEPALLELMSGLLARGLSTRNPWVLNTLLENYAYQMRDNLTHPAPAEVVDSVRSRAIAMSAVG